ncbi:unnamed protein product [Orchesella dallaii]|uniref:Inactive serine protease scarface clip-domain domain-containing protein n=1 Tax=Orchesella dallaii TaxID=48710 RepID=A0ABP1S3B2_9HEXA
MWSTRKVLLTVTLVASLAALAQGQGYGASDDDDLPQQPNKFPHNNQQISALPQYESTENFQQQNQQPHRPQQQQQGNNNNGQNLWWMGQNAFQRPPGHPGVEMLDPKNPGGQQAQQGNTHRNPNSYNPPAQGHNAFGGGQPQQQNQPQYNNPGPQQQHNNQPPQNQYNNPGPQDQPQNQFNNPGPQNQPQNQFNNPGPQDKPQNQFNNPGPQNQPQNQYNNPGPQEQQNNQRPQDQQPQPQNQYNNPSPPQQPQFNNPGPQQQFNPAPQQQFNNAGAGQQPGAGWNAPQQQQRPSGFGKPDEAPGCDLVNKADCHKLNEPQAPPQNNFNAPKPQQNYQPPPLNPEPFPQQPQQPYQPPPPQQQPIQEPNLAYRPPPSQQQPSQQAPSPNPYNRPTNSQPSQPSLPSQNNFQNQPPKQQQQPYQPPQAPRPPPQQQFQNSGQGVRPNPPQQQQRQPPADTGELPPYPGCPAAMLCVQDDYCNTIGLIEDSPIQLSAADKLHRVALMQCSEPMTGIVGVCCRDPNYKDPWPDMQGGGGMMKKDGGAHHHPDKGQPNQGHSQALGNGIAHQPPKGNHLSSGNPYSGTKSPFNNGSRVSKSISSPSAASSLPSESKLTLQVLEPCTSDELCISMSHCSTLNPQFMAKTGLNSGKTQSSTNSTELFKVKRCKYERSGVQYLCCKKPERVTTSTPRPAFSITTTRPFSFSTPSFNTRRTPLTPRPFSTTSNFITHPSVTTYHPSLITGVGLRFHSNLHTPQRKQLDSKKPNPYGENEQPILLISPTTPTPFVPFTFGPTAKHTFRFTTTSTTTPRPTLPFRTRFPVREQNAFPPSLATSTVSASTRSRPIAFQSKFPTTTPISTSVGAGTRNPIRFHNAPIPFSLSQNSQTISSFSRGSTTSIVPSTTANRPFDKIQKFTTVSATTLAPPTTSQNVFDNHIVVSYPATTRRPVEISIQEKFDLSKIPLQVPLKKEFKEDPPIGFVWKGEELYLPEVLIPPQNYILPAFNFEERTLPTEPPQEDTEIGGQTVESTTTVFRVVDFDEIGDNSARQRI